ncbi:P-loop containing nucleoside triphosphate hydrolase protein [Gyrodon lividus]|nr:P-loop containing nucleoside triphosphate hydrolase protein [Gyrodon lividus]
MFDSSQIEKDCTVADQKNESSVPFQQHFNLQLDTGNEYLKFRQKWWQLWLPKDPPPPPPASLEDAKMIPLATTGMLSELTFTWITDIMVLGYQRTLQAADLYKMDPTREAGRLSEKLEAAWARRVTVAANWNERLERGEIHPSFLARLSFAFRAIPSSQENKARTYAERRIAPEEYWSEVVGRKEPSLTWALNDVFGSMFWIGGVFKVIGDTVQLMGPIVLKVRVYHARAAGEPVPNFFRRSMTAGVLARAALIASVYERGVSLTGKGRVKFTNATLVNHISTDVSRIDTCAQWFVSRISLFASLGPSALAGFALFVLIIPIQERAMTLQHRILLLEVLSAMRVVKYFSYELPFLQKIFALRKQELRGIRRILHSSSANLALANCLPVLAATLAFVTYTLTAHDFNVAVIFSSLSLFNLLRQPMMFFPLALSAIPDAASAIERLTHVFNAELTKGETLVIDSEQGAALIVKDATFEWESSEKVDETIPEIIDGGRGRGRRCGGRGGRGGAGGRAKEEDIEVNQGKEGRIFIVRNVTLTIARGQLTAIVGPVGSGKSSSLQGIIGEMRRVSGHVSFGGRVGYCPQTALGEKGIYLSGGQQRVNIARALYCDPEIVVFDDPLSAVDAHVGKALFEEAIIGALRDRGITVILVTHAIHFLSQVDYIYTMNNGVFAKLDREYGGRNKDEEEGEGKEVEEAVAQNQGMTVEDAKLKSAQARQKATGRGMIEGCLIVKEQRTTGSVSLGVYWAYMVAARGALTVGMQASSIMNSYVLIWWEANAWHRPISFYQILYGCLGVAQAIFTFLLGVGMDFMAFYVSQDLHHECVKILLCAPMSFFNSTPMGRILSVFGKDVDSLDNQLAFALTLSTVLSSVLIISILEPYFHSMLRSLLYAHFSETLTGLPTIRSYGETKRFIDLNRYYIDLEDRSLYPVVTNQRWLAIRLAFMGGLLVFLVAMLSATDVSGINAAQIAYLSQSCSLVTRQSADVESEYNDVLCKVVQYIRDDTIPQEAPHEIESTKPEAGWPSQGAIEFKNVVMSYRPGLPVILNGISLSIKGGEKIGVVGRTGAGKSSLMLTLYRIVELSGGSIVLDGIDISTIGLKDLRTKISIIPQDHKGTIRSNLDPFCRYDDATLWDALRRSCLVGTTSDNEEVVSGEETPKNRYNLDSVIESEGANLSVGERSLLSLARALVKDCKVVVLDEATASVDLETDNKIQRTIQTEFSNRTLLCIAHRLRTIVSYDRILVLDAGPVAEFDTPYNLYQKKGGLFRGMCERSNISLTNIKVGTRDMFGSPEA